MVLQGGGGSSGAAHHINARASGSRSLKRWSGLMNGKRGVSLLQRTAAQRLLRSAGRAMLGMQSLPPSVDPEEHDDSAWSSDARSDSGASDEERGHETAQKKPAAATSSESEGDGIENQEHARARRQARKLRKQMKQIQHTLHSLQTESVSGRAKLAATVVDATIAETAGLLGLGKFDRSSRQSGHRGKSGARLPTRR